MAYSGCWYLFLMLTTVMQYFLTFLCWCTLSIPLQLLNTDNSLLITANTLSLSDKERALLLSLLSFSLTLVEQPTYGNCLPWLQHSSTLLSPKKCQHYISGSIHNHLRIPFSSTQKKSTYSNFPPNQPLFQLVSSPRQRPIQDSRQHHPYLLPP